MAEFFELNKAGSGPSTNRGSKDSMYRVVDGDTVADKAGRRYRVKGIDTREVADRDGKGGTNQGEVQTRILEDLIKSQGYDQIHFTGESDSRNDSGESRPLIELRNQGGSNTTDEMMYEGFAAPRRFASNEDVQRTLLGRRNRELGETTSEGYDQHRADLAQARDDDGAFWKTPAMDESYFNPDYNSDVLVRRNDRDIYNKADNAFTTGFSGGVDTMQQGFWGVVEMVGARSGLKYLEKKGKKYVDLNSWEMEDQPEFISNVDDVTSVSQFGEWAAGALGGSAPFFALVAAGFVPGLQGASFSSMAMTYAGQTWNDMKGTADEKSMAIAMASGVAMSMFERLGGEAVLGGMTPKHLLQKKHLDRVVNNLVKNKSITKAEAKILLKETREDVIADTLTDLNQNSAIKMAWDIYAKDVGKATLSGIAGEAVTEGLQESTQYAAAHLGSGEGLSNFSNEEFLSRIRNAVAAGGLLGGGMKGAHAVVSAGPDLRQLKHMAGKAVDGEEGVAPLDMKEVLATASGQNLHGPSREVRKSEGMNDLVHTAISDMPDVIDGEYVAARREEQRVAKEAIDAVDENTAGWRDAKERAELKHRFLKLRADMAFNTRVKNDLETVGDNKSSHYAGVIADISKTESALYDLAFEIDAFNAKPERTMTTWEKSSNAGTNSEKVKGLIDKHVTNQKAKSILGRGLEVATDLEWLSSSYTVLKKRLGEGAAKSRTLIAEMDFSGWTEGRGAYGETFMQLKRNIEGAQHQALYNIATDLSKALGKTRPTAANRLKAFAELSEFYDEVKSYARDGIPISKRFEIHQDSFEAALESVYKFEQEQADMIRSANIDYDYIVGATFDSKRLNPTLVQASKERFVKKVMAYHEMSRADAEKEYDIISGVPRGYDPYEFVDTDFLSKKPVTMKNRLHYDNKIFAEFFEQDDYLRAKTRATEISNYVGDITAMGHGGQGLNSKILQIETELVDEMGQEYADKWMPEISATIYSQYKAHRGEYNKIQDENTRHIAGNIGSIMSLAYMGLATIASLPEAGLAFLGSNKEGVVKGAHNAAKIASQGIVKQFQKIADFEYDTSDYDEAQNRLRGRGMLTHEYGAGHLVDAEVGNDRKNWLQKRLMPDFYKWTGLTAYTSYVRMIRDSIANDFIASHQDIVMSLLEKQEADSTYKMNRREADSITKLRELGLDPLEFAANTKQMLIDWATANLKLEKEGKPLITREKHIASSALAQRIARETDLARSNFVDAALVNPDAGKRPLFYSDGRFRLLTIFQGYLSVFSATIIKPMLKDLAGKGTPKDQMNAAAVMSTMIFLGFLGQALKDEIKYGDKPSWLTDGQYVQRGMQASGLMGQTERIFNLFFPLYHSKEDTAADKAWSEVGPLANSIDSFYEGTKFAMEGEGEKSLNKYFKLMPGGVLTNYRQALAQGLSGGNNEPK